MQQLDNSNLYPLSEEAIATGVTQRVKNISGVGLGVSVYVPVIYEVKYVVYKDIRYKLKYPVPPRSCKLEVPFIKDGNRFIVCGDSIRLCTDTGHTLSWQFHCVGSELCVGYFNVEEEYQQHGLKGLVDTIMEGQQTMSTRNLGRHDGRGKPPSNFPAWVEDVFNNCSHFISIKYFKDNDLIDTKPIRDAWTIESDDKCIT